MSETVQPPDLVAVTGLDGHPYIIITRNLLVIMIFSKNYHYTNVPKYMVGTKVIVCVETAQNVCL